MLIDFFFTLRDGGLPVSVTEYLALIEGLEKRVVYANIDEFYHLSRTAMVKKESDYDKFDRAFGVYFVIPHRWCTRRGAFSTHVNLNVSVCFGCL